MFIKTSFAQKHRVNTEYTNRRKERAGSFLERDRRDLAKETDLNASGLNGNEAGDLGDDPSSDGNIGIGGGERDSKVDEDTVNHLVQKIKNLNQEEKSMLDQILNKVSHKKTQKYVENSYKRHNSNATQQNIANEYFKPNPHDSTLSHNNEWVRSSIKNSPQDHYISFSSKSSMQKFNHHNKTLIPNPKHAPHNPSHITKNISSGQIHPSTSHRVKKPIYPTPLYPPQPLNPTMTTDTGDFANNMFGSRDCSWKTMMQEPNEPAVLTMKTPGSPN